MKKWLAALAAVSTVCIVAPQAEANETVIQDGIHYEIFVADSGKTEARVVARVQGQTIVSFADAINGVPVTELAPSALLVTYEQEEVQLNEFYEVHRLPAQHRNNW